MYTVRYGCSNCNTVFTKHIPKGQLAPRTTICSHCGCSTAKKSQWGSQKVSKWERASQPYEWDEHDGTNSATANDWWRPEIV